MRKITTGVVVTCACLLAASAAAETLRRSDAHAPADFGVGGWIPNYGAKPIASGSVAVVNVSRPDRGFGEDFDRRLHRFDADSDCLFPQPSPAFGRRWRDGCK
jgi:hypothetical protein